MYGFFIIKTVTYRLDFRIINKEKLEKFRNNG